MSPTCVLGRKLCRGAIAQGAVRPLVVVDQAVTLGVSDVAAIRYLLDQEPRPARPCPEAIEIGRLARYERPLPSMAEYDRLLGSLTTTVIQ